MHNNSMFYNVHINNIIKHLNETRNDQHLSEYVQQQNIIEKVNQYIKNNHLEQELSFQMLGHTRGDFRYKNELTTKILKKENDNQVVIEGSDYNYKTPTLHIKFEQVGEEDLRFITLKKIIQEKEVNLMYLKLSSDRVGYNKTVSLSSKSKEIYDTWLGEVLDRSGVELSLNELIELKQEIQPVLDFAKNLKNLQEESTELYQKTINNIIYGKSFTKEDLDLIILRCDIDFSNFESANFLPRKNQSNSEFKIERLSRD